MEDLNKGGCPKEDIIRSARKSHTQEGRYRLVITPAIAPKERHKIEDTIEELGYHVTGGGQCMDGSESDVSFIRKTG